MLLARLQRQTQGGCALAVFGHADQTARHGALECILASHEAGMRAAKTQRHAKTLCRTDGDIGAPFSWRSEEHTSEFQSLMRISYAVFCLKKKKKTCRVRITHSDV